MPISSPGLGSGLDVNSIITKLMALESRPLNNLKTQQTGLGNQISAMGKVKSAIAALQTASKAISSSSSLYSFKGSLADTTIGTVTTDSTAIPGSYSIEVEQLAKAHKLRSATGIDPSAGGTLTIELGSTAGGSFVANSGTSPVTVTINAGATLTDVAKAINGANAGVGAAVINGQGGQQLVLTSNNTGETYQMRIASTISGLAFNPDSPATPGNLSQIDNGQNAILKVDGITVANTSSNTVSNAITGITLNLTKANLGTPTTLTVANDSSGLQSKAEAFVKAYNDARSTMKSLSQYDPTGKNTGVLNGDSTLTSALNQLRNALSTVPGGVDSSLQYLHSIGIQSQSDGSLKLDSSALQSAMNKNFAGVATTLAAYGTAFDTLTTNMLSTDGLISTRTEGLSTSSSRINDRIDTMGRQLALVEKRYRAQFTALDVMMGKFSTTSSYLSQQLSALSK